MKILLLEEYSGFFSNLKKGFEKEGHEVILCGTPDNWKKIQGLDLYIGSPFKGIIDKIIRRIQLLLHLKKFKGFDVVLILNQSFFLWGLSNLVLNYVAKNNKKIFLISCGGDVPYAEYGLSGKFKKGHWPYENCEDNNILKYKNAFNTKLHKKIASVINGVIPITYEYSVSWKSSEYEKLVKSTIQSPIDTDSIKPFYLNLKKEDKVVFFHGLNREGYKGTDFIRIAMENMKKKYPSKMKIIIDGRMPLKKYLKTLETVDVIIDSCKAYTYSSMNTLYGMSLGKVLMVHCEEECLREFNLPNLPPLIKIKAEVAFIENQIEKVINRDFDLNQLSRQSRQFATSFHDSRIVAKKYSNLFDSN